MAFNSNTISKINDAVANKQKNGAFTDKNKTMALLNAEATKLYNFLMIRIEAYYASYMPKYYVRTYYFKHSLRVSPIFTNLDGQMAIKVYFDETLGLHDWGYDYVPNNPHGFVPFLIDSGWEVKKDVFFKGTEHFGFQKGFDIVDYAVKEYEKTNKYNVKILNNFGY